MGDFFSFFVVLFAAVFFSALFNRLHLPWVIALIVAGVVIGPAGFAVFEADQTIEFIGEIGLVFLMFMAGLETRVSSIRHDWVSVSILALATSIIPFAVGGLTALFFGFGYNQALLLGILFVSTSVAVVVPALEAANVFHTRLGRVLIESTIVTDALSLFLLSLILQVTGSGSATAIWLLYPFLLAVIVGLRFAIPRIHKAFTISGQTEKLFQQELRLVFMLLLGIVIIFELLGLHIIIASFFAGIILSQSISSDVLKGKLRAISYGLFVPVFFILVGTRTDIRQLVTEREALFFTIAVVVGVLLSKIISGWLAARVSKFSDEESVFIGLAMTPSLTTSLAVAFTALEIGLIDNSFVTAIIVLSVVSTLVGSISMAILGRKLAKQEKFAAESQP